jgi:hypothetical protein
MTEKTTTRIRVQVERYVRKDRQALVLSVFGNDSDIGAITAAVHEKATFNLTLPDGTTKDISFGEHASCYKGSVRLLDRKDLPLRRRFTAAANSRKSISVSGQSIQASVMLCP